VVGREELARHLPLLEPLGLSIEHADALAGEFGEPDAALVIDAAAARARALGRRRIERNFAALGVDLADVFAAEAEEPDVVLLVGEDRVGRSGTALERL